MLIDDSGRIIGSVRSSFPCFHTVLYGNMGKRSSSRMTRDVDCENWSTGKTFYRRNLFLQFLAFCVPKIKVGRSPLLGSESGRVPEQNAMLIGQIGRRVKILSQKPYLYLSAICVP
jgi:hypothetical protein